MVDGGALFASAYTIRDEEVAAVLDRFDAEPPLTFEVEIAADLSLEDAKGAACTSSARSFSARRSQSEMTNQEREVFSSSTPQDVRSAGAKSQGKGKVIADKWNQ